MGFGLDSVVEVSSALVIAWRLTRGASETAERRAVRLIAVSFFVIALYVTVDAVLKLTGVSEKPEESTIGLAITALSLVVMPALAWGKRRVAAGLGSVALKADAAETQLCTYLSAVVLVGLTANWLAGGGGWTRSRRWWLLPLPFVGAGSLDQRRSLHLLNRQAKTAPDTGDSLGFTSRRPHSASGAPLPRPRHHHHAADDRDHDHGRQRPVGEPPWRGGSQARSQGFSRQIRCLRRPRAPLGRLQRGQTALCECQPIRQHLARSCQTVAASVRATT